MIEYITLDQQAKELYKREGIQDVIKLLENNKDKTGKEILDIIRNTLNVEPKS